MKNSPTTRYSLIGRLHDKADAEAWSEFTYLYEPLITSFAMQKGLQHADAAEVTQEVLARVAGAIESWEPDPEKGAFRGWLYRITRNLTIDHLRQNRRRPAEASAEDIEQLASPGAEEAQEFRLEFERQLFHWAADRVKPSFKQANWDAFWLSAVEEQAVPVVAERLGITPGAVYVARSRVMARIAKVIQKKLEETDP